MSKASIIFLNPKAVCGLLNPPMRTTFRFNGRPQKTGTIKDGKFSALFLGEGRRRYEISKRNVMPTPKE